MAIIIFTAIIFNVAYVRAADPS